MDVSAIIVKFSKICWSPLRHRYRGIAIGFIIYQALMCALSYYIVEDVDEERNFVR
jgi:hypothetical protein